jgi:hypothetical protein
MEICLHRSYVPSWRGQGKRFFNPVVHISSETDSCLFDQVFSALMKCECSFPYVQKPISEPSTITAYSSPTHFLEIILTFLSHLPSWFSHWRRVCVHPVTNVRSAHLILVNSITQAILGVKCKIWGFQLRSCFRCNVISPVLLFLRTDLGPLTRQIIRSMYLKTQTVPRSKHIPSRL